jgi:hypothetical protein
MPDFNAACDAGFYYSETLASLRRDLLVRLGYAAQADNPPPGMADLLDSFLQRGQKFLYRRHAALETKRYFSWTMTVGERFYGILSNEDSCAKKLRPEMIESAWVEDLNGTWIPLARGINPALFTSVDFNGLPAFYDVRQTIEVFPAPAEAYTLHVFGRFGLMAFTEDTDYCTVDPDLLFLWALANAKNHYGQADAQDIASEAQTMLRDIIADSHGNTRYIPGAEPSVPATRPTMAGGWDA